MPGEDGHRCARQPGRVLSVAWSQRRRGNTVGHCEQDCRGAQENKSNQRPANEQPMVHPAPPLPHRACVLVRWRGRVWSASGDSSLLAQLPHAPWPHSHPTLDCRPAAARTPPYPRRHGQLLGVLPRVARPRAADQPGGRSARQTTTRHAGRGTGRGWSTERHRGDTDRASASSARCPRVPSCPGVALALRSAWSFASRARAWCAKRNTWGPPSQAKGRQKQPQRRGTGEGGV